MDFSTTIIFYIVYKRDTIMSIIITWIFFYLVIAKPLIYHLYCRSLSAPLVPKRTLPRFRLQVHPDQPQDGSYNRQSRQHHRTHKGTALFPAAKWAHHVGRPVWSVLPDRRGRVHMRSLRVHASIGHKSNTSGQLQRWTENRSPKSIQVLRHDDLF